MKMTIDRNAQEIVALGRAKGHVNGKGTVIAPVRRVTGEDIKQGLNTTKRDLANIGLDRLGRSSYSARREPLEGRNNTENPLGARNKRRTRGVLVVPVRKRYAREHKYFANSYSSSDDEQGEMDSNINIEEYVEFRRGVNRQRVERIDATRTPEKTMGQDQRVRNDRGTDTGENKKSAKYSAIPKGLSYNGSGNE